MHLTRVLPFYHPQTKLWQGYDFTGVCDSVHGGGGGFPVCITDFQAHTQGGGWGVWPGGLQAHTQWGGWGVWPGGSPGPHPGGRLRGLARGSLQAHTRGCLQAHTWGGLQAHTQGGVSQHALRQIPPVDSYCCRQYASYWNAFLYLSAKPNVGVNRLFFTVRQNNVFMRPNSHRYKQLTVLHYYYCM